VARPVEIDRDAAFRVARDLFWRRGYVATSLGELLDAMGISRSSFYAAFGGKRALFEAVLDDYRARTADILARIDAREAGLDALGAFLARTIVEPTGEERRRGCLLVNSVIELEAVDAGLHARGVEALGELRLTIDRWLRAAAEAGALRADVPVEALVDATDLTVRGLRVASREGASRAELRRRVEGLLALLGAPRREAA